MNQFKDVFLGLSKPGYNSATTSQKCIRVGGKHNDLDNVGHTSRHMTFFEMLGNFSFGDYFKKEAIDFAYEVSLNVYEFEKDKLWVTVYEDDEESFQLWQKYFPKNRIVKMGKRDNFWTMGDIGPCGPCSELFYDCGEHLSKAKDPSEDEEGLRFLEYWNLVFMEFNLEKSGKMSPLPLKGVDTGSGLERVLSIKEKTFNVFHIDIFKTLIAQISNILEVKYDQNDPDISAAFHVICDHLRSLCFAMADGAQPSNIERGYVLRKLVRRAIRHAKILGAEKPFLAQLVPTLIDIMGGEFQELIASQQRICEILTKEEESFFKTLKRGGNILSSIIQKAKETNTKEISGEDAFKLKDTYGFPLEEILLIAKDYHLEVNLEAYSILEEKAKELSKKSRQVESKTFQSDLFQDFEKKHGKIAFCGYKSTSAKASIIAILKDDRFVDTLEFGEEGIIFVDSTPFYAEKGGQTFDIGTLGHSEANFIVKTIVSPITDLIGHKGQVNSGTFIVGEPVDLVVDKKRREKIAANHTATHLLHYALQKVLGEHVKQAGSLVEADKLRFDFNHHEGLTQDELRQIEIIVNEKIRENLPIKNYELSLEEVQNHSDIKQFFGDKYGKIVRVVDIGGYSKELCGGTHAKELSTLGLFKVLKETSIAQGVRRIEAVTAGKALEAIYEIQDRLKHLSDKLSVPLPKLENAFEKLLEESKQLKSEVKSLKTLQMKQVKEALQKKIAKENDFFVLCSEVELDPKDLFAFSNSIFQEKKLNALLFGVRSKGRCQILIKLDKKAQELGLNAKELIKELSPLIGGGGGGKPDCAQAGGTNQAGLDEIYSKFVQLIKEKC